VPVKKKKKKGGGDTSVLAKCVSQANEMCVRETL
jgi:hypothetical protein